MLKLAISNIAWTNEEEHPIAEVMKAHGLKGVETAPTKLWPNMNDAGDDGVAMYRRFWNDHGIAVIATQALLFGHPELTIFTNDATRAATLDYLTHVFRVAAGLGAVAMVFGSPRNRLKGDLTHPEALAIASEFFREAAARAAQVNTILCIEPNPPAYGCDFITTTAEAVELVEAVNHAGLQINLDSAIMTMMGEDVPASIDRALPHLAHFHISEPQLQPIGKSGEVDHAGIAAHLRRVNYGRWVSIEMRSGWADSNVETVETALKKVTQIYNG